MTSLCVQWVPFECLILIAVGHNFVGSRACVKHAEPNAHRLRLYTNTLCYLWVPSWHGYAAYMHLLVCSNNGKNMIFISVMKFLKNMNISIIMDYTIYLQSTLYTQVDDLVCALCCVNVNQRHAVAKWIWPFVFLCGDDNGDFFSCLSFILTVSTTLFTHTRCGDDYHRLQSIPLTLLFLSAWP